MGQQTLSVRSMFAAYVIAPAVLLAPLAAYSQALEEITVVARKRAEDLQEVPMAITAISSDQIERLNLQDLSDITNQDTSVQFDEGFTPSDTRITIRGLSPTRGRPNAATLVDGIDVTSEAVSNAGGSTLINPRLIDVERIEIVKGPQSALYGRSAFAGAVQYVTKDPGDVLAGEVFVNGNNEDDRELRGSVSVPISDTLGMLVNGYAWDADGYYNNSATGGNLGGGDGQGGSITFKWEPTDSFGLKWRTEYSEDNYDPAPQALLNDLNRVVDLNNVPGATVCEIAPNGPEAAGNLSPGPIKTGDCLLTPGQSYDLDGDGNLSLIDNVTFQLNEGFANLTDLGQYDPSQPRYLFQYDKAVNSLYAGKIPDGDKLSAALTPNYRDGIGASDPANAQDFDGTGREVFRTALNLDWAIDDDLTFYSNSGYVDSNVSIQTDIGKYYTDDCSANVQSLETRPDPTGNFASYADALRARGITNLAKYAPCTTPGGDGINDSSIQFVQDDSTDTKQKSQEFRLAWQASETVNFTSGLQYWEENVDVDDINSAAIAGGAECFLLNGNDISQNAGQAAFFQIDGIQDKCGNTDLIVAYHMQDLADARKAGANSETQRNTEHYSWYGSLDWDFTEKFTVRVEARYFKENNDVTGVVQTPCLNGELPLSFYTEGGGDGGPVPQGADPCDNTVVTPDKTEVANGGQATGPSNVILCGQVGRCDALGIAPVSGSDWYAGNNIGSTGSLQNFDGDSWWAFGFAPAPGVPQTLRRTDREWAPKATLEYFWNEDVMTYFSWSRGIKPGGFSLLTSGAFGLDANLDGDFDEIEFTPERLDVWEVGAKTTLFEGRVRLNGAVFYQDFKDKQIGVQVVTGGTTGTKVENIGGSEVRGLELDMTWQITENWLTSLGYTYLDTEYTDYDVTTTSTGDITRLTLDGRQDCSQHAQLPGGEADDWGCALSYNGNELERSPKNAVLGNLTYSNSLFDTGMEWYGQADYRYQSSRYVEAFNIVKFQEYHRTDLRFGIQADRWDVQLYVTNVLDDDTVLSGGSNPGIPTGSFGFGFSVPPGIGSGGPGINAGPKLPSDIYANLPDPRIVGLNAKFRFGGE